MPDGLGLKRIRLPIGPDRLSPELEFHYDAVCLGCPLGNRTWIDLDVSTHRPLHGFGHNGKLSPKGELSLQGLAED